jgi:replication-associated recombination protein RarA
MPDLFDEQAEQAREERAPLADRMRPRTLDEFVGQEHFIGEGKLLRRAIEADRVTSVLFYGPPGTGKTTLATAPKSNTTFAYFDALDHVREEQTEDIPQHLKDPSRDKEGLGHGEGYKYPHAYREHYTPQQYLPNEMQGTYFYDPSGQGYEEAVAERLEQWRERDFDKDGVKRAQKYAERTE